MREFLVTHGWIYGEFMGEFMVKENEACDDILFCSNRLLLNYIGELIFSDFFYISSTKVMFCLSQTCKNKMIRVPSFDEQPVQVPASGSR